MASDGISGGSPGGRQDPDMPHQQAQNLPPQPPQPAVRFASVNQEIEPAHSLEAAATTSTDTARPETASRQEEQELKRSLSKGLQDAHLQQSRMNNFSFEPISLPVSRVPSNESSQHQASREATRSGRATPRVSPSTSATANLGDHANISGADLTKVHPDPLEMTPQLLPGSRDATSGGTSSNMPSRPSSASDQVSTRPTSQSQGSTGADAVPKVPRFSGDQSGESPAPSRGSSPSRTPAGGSGTVTPPSTYSRPFTPIGDRDDPYARSKRPPQRKNLDAIDPRFVFGSVDNRRRSANLPSTASSATDLPRSSSGNDLKSQHRQSTFSLHGFGSKKDQHSHVHDEDASAPGGKHHHGSMTELKRFFGLGNHKHKQAHSPSVSVKGSAKQSGTRTPPHQLPAANVPFADDHGLETKYGKFGKVLGQGAGGSVRLIKRSSDGTTFAVKQFRARHPYEAERVYSKKVTAEFCIGSTLHHGNVIETLDIIHEKDRWFEVMEYAPYDLFAIVMTGKMSREEISCSFLQIVSGVSYLHSMGLAHRDLKLDNVVVNEHGIMKIIDFGSATVFQYPFENDIILATGVVGSDPYLAPEVYDSHRYDPQPTDIWSLAIIFACMTLRRFPWKSPRLTDNSFKLFASPPNDGTPSAGGSSRPKSEVLPTSGVEDVPRASDRDSSFVADNDDTKSTHSHHHRHHHHHAQDEPDTHTQSTGSPSSLLDKPGKEPLKGPWRLLRLLPRESRNVIGSMLDLDPQRRATLESMMKDPWVAESPVCTQVEGGEVISAEGHHHTLEHSTAVGAAKSKQ